MKNFMMLALAGAMFCGLVSGCGETSQGMVIAPPTTTPTVNPGGSENASYTLQSVYDSAPRFP